MSSRKSEKRGDSVVDILHSLSGGSSKDAVDEGGTKQVQPRAVNDAGIDDDGEECLWLLQQLSLRQQRLHLLSSALEEAGGEPLPTLKKRGPVLKVPKTWDCTLAQSLDDEEDEEEDEELNKGVAESVLQCLIMGEVLPGFKAVAPQGTAKWVTLWELNKMRRSEPQKVSGLWYDQFSVDCNAFSAQAGPPGQVLSFLLDRPWALRGCVLAALLTVAGVLRKPLSMALVKVLTSGPLWRSFLSWSRIVYAPLPAKIYFVQLFWSMVLATQLRAVERIVREKLIEAECELVEYAMPVSVATPQVP